MGGRDSCRDLRPHSRYRTLFVDDELTPGVLPRSALTRLIAGFGLPLPILNLGVRQDRPRASQGRELQRLRPSREPGRAAV